MNVGVVVGDENAPGVLGEPELPGPGQLDDAVHRLAHDDLGQCGGDVVGRLRLGRTRPPGGQCRQQYSNRRCAGPMNSKSCVRPDDRVGTDPVFTVSPWTTIARR